MVVVRKNRGQRVLVLRMLVVVLRLESSLHRLKSWLLVQNTPEPTKQGPRRMQGQERCQKH